MREILFRGKRLKDGAWIEGFYCEFANNMSGEQEHFIQTVKSDGRIDTLYHVDPATVGQYTGLTDKNGKRIFEGDILENVWKFDNIVVSREIYVVTFFGGAFGTEQYAHGKRQNNSIPFADNEFGTNERHCEVIGNIPDNPELLEAT